MLLSSQAEERLQRVPALRRSREYRLYTLDGRRLLDCFQDGGRAILGHRTPGMVSRIKNDLERGLSTVLPGRDSDVLAIRLRELVPGGGNLGCFRNLDRALDCVRGLGETADPSVTEPFAPISQIVFWRPFLPDKVWQAVLETDPMVVMPLLPGPPILQMQPALFRRGTLPRNETVPRVEISCAVSAVDALSNAQPRGSLPVPGFRSVGPYLFLDVETDYDFVFDSFLEGGILLSPEPTVPSIIPAIMSAGERVKLERIAQSVLTGETHHGY
jgi:hypothetical protein